MSLTTVSKAPVFFGSGVGGKTNGCVFLVMGHGDTKSCLFLGVCVCMPWHADALPVYISFKNEGKWSDQSTWLFPMEATCPFPRVPVSATCNDAAASKDARFVPTLAPENAKKACEEAFDRADTCTGVPACVCRGVVYLGFFMGHNKKMEICRGAETHNGKKWRSVGAETHNGGMSSICWV